MLRPYVTRERRGAIALFMGVARKDAGSRENICRFLEAAVRLSSANQGFLSAIVRDRYDQRSEFGCAVSCERRGASATGRRPRQRGMRSTSEFAGLARVQRAPDFVRRSVFPASKRVAKIRRLAEAQGMGDIIDRHLSIAQIFYRHLGPQLVEEIPKRSLFVA